MPKSSLWAQLDLYPDLPDSTTHLLSAHLSLTKFTPRQQASLAQDGRPFVRCWLAANPHLLIKWQTKLALDHDLEVRCSLAANPSLASRVQFQLLTDRRAASGCKIGVVVTPLSTSPPIYLAGLVTSINSQLASNPSLNTKIQRKLICSTSLDTRHTLAGNPALLPELQNSLFYDKSFTVRYTLAANRSLSPELQLKFVATKNYRFIFALASNPALLPSLQEQFARKRSSGIVQALLSNKNLTLPSALEVLRRFPYLQDTLKIYHPPLYQKIRTGKLKFAYHHNLGLLLFNKYELPKSIQPKFTEYILSLPD